LFVFLSLLFLLGSLGHIFGYDLISYGLILLDLVGDGQLTNYYNRQKFVSLYVY